MRREIPFFGIESRGCDVVPRVEVPSVCSVRSKKTPKGLWQTVVPSALARMGVLRLVRVAFAEPEHQIIVGSIIVPRLKVGRISFHPTGPAKIIQNYSIRGHTLWLEHLIILLTESGAAQLLLASKQAEIQHHRKGKSKSVASGTLNS